MTTEVITPPGTITEWGNEDWTIFQDWLKDVLRREVVEIVFTKVDGSERVMNCTLRADKVVHYAPSASEEFSDSSKQSEVNSKSSIDMLLDEVKRIKKPAQPPNEVVNAFDIDKNQWRSFRLRNITNILTLLLKYGTQK